MQREREMIECESCVLPYYRWHQERNGEERKTKEGRRERRTGPVLR